MENQLQFRISSGLKNIIGRDLITDDFIAIFELVKNSHLTAKHSRTASTLILKEKASYIIKEKLLNVRDVLKKVRLHYD